MRFALTATTETGRIALVWSNNPDDVAGGAPTEREEGYRLLGSQSLVRRAERLILLERTVGGGRFQAGLSTPHQAYLTLLAAIRGYEHPIGPIDFAGVDDDGVEMDFMPIPEANHLPTM